MWVDSGGRIIIFDPQTEKWLGMNISDIGICRGWGYYKMRKVVLVWF